jgi:hypothetical protein
MAELNDKFSGQAASSVQGYSGQIALLNVALANSAEIIGKDLLDSINLVSGANGIGKTTSAIENMATSIGNATYGIASLINRLKGVYQDTFIGDVFGLVGKLPNLSTFGATAKARSAGTPAQSPGQRKAIDKANAEALKLQKSKNALSIIDNNLSTRKLVLTADQQALEELKKKFDIDRIQINAALNSNIDKETELRLKSLLAIHDNDAALAGKIKAEIDAANAVGLFASAARQAALLLQTSYSAGLSSFKQSEINSLTQGPTAPNPLATPAPTVPMSPLESFRQNEARYANYTPPVNLTISLDGQVFNNAVLNATQGASSNGTNVSYTGLV